MRLLSALKVLCVVLLFAAALAGPAQAAGDPLDAKVSLTKPYPESYKGAETERMAVEYAVIELAKQAGLGYDFKTSFTNTDPACRKWVTPKIEGIPLREALDQILKPEGLTYEVHDGGIVLKKQSGPAQAAGDPLDAKVSLTKPYPESYKDAGTEKIAIQYAVLELAKQAGLGYDFKTSFTNTDPICRKWVTPQIAGMTLREALDKVLTAEGLTYEVRAGKIVLKKR